MSMSTERKTTLDIDRHINAGLIVSCQPVEHGPMDNHEVVVRLAKAALAGGADGVRIEGAERVARVRQALPEALVIGIVKRDLEEFPVRITPYASDVIALAQAGADIIAIDATLRSRPETVASLIEKIHACGKVAMADCSNLSNAEAASRAGAEIIGTTLSGYTGGPVPQAPDFALLQELALRFPRVMAEGRFNSPRDTAQARNLGAWAVTVGTAITRTEVVTQWFVDALSGCNSVASEKIATT